MSLPESEENDLVEKHYKELASMKSELEEKEKEKEELITYYQGKIDKEFEKSEHDSVKMKESCISSFNFKI